HHLDLLSCSKMAGLPTWHFKEVVEKAKALKDSPNEPPLRIYQRWKKALYEDALRKSDQMHKTFEKSSLAMTHMLEVPSFDEPEPQPQPLPSYLSLDESLGEERGPDPPTKPHSPDSLRMMIVDHLTSHIPLLPHVARKDN
nr:hypothetical protein [Tanacetum cinerariifolium]